MGTSDSSKLDGNDNPTIFPCQDELIALFGTLINVMFCVKDLDGVYIEVNGAFVRRTGLTSKRDVVGSTARDIFIADLAERYEEQDRQVLSTGEALRDELELIRRPDGDLGWYLTTKIPVADRALPRDMVGLVSVSRDLLAPTSESIALESLHNVITYVRNHLAEVIRVADLADTAGISSAQLDRRMRRVFGLTPKQYLLRVRVDHAAHLLADTDTPLATIAATAGFYDQPDFTRRFARLTNQTPAQFRASSR